MPAASRPVSMARPGSGAHFRRKSIPFRASSPAFHFEYLRSLERPIYMDGRPHPPDYAPHTWSGFSTGKWQGNMLVVTTTHLKGAYLRRNGASFSDNATMMEYITRHGDYLLITMIVTDPVWLEEPFIQTTNYELDPHTQLDSIPVHRQRREYLHRGTAFPAGAEPESRRGRHSADRRARRRGIDVSGVPKEVERPWASAQSVAETEPICDERLRLLPNPRRTAEIHVLPVQGNVYMLVGAGGNITASIGKDGILLVDAGPADMVAKVMSTMLQLATAITASPEPNRCLGLHCAQTPAGWTSPSLNAIISSPAPPKPVRFIINTSVDADHTGGNERLAELPADAKIVGVTFPPVGVAPTAEIIAHENVLHRMSEPSVAGKTPAAGRFLADRYVPHGVLQAQRVFQRRRRADLPPA